MPTDLAIPSIQQMNNLLFDVESNDDSIAELQQSTVATIKMLEEELAEETDAEERDEINRMLTGLRFHLQELNRLGVKTLLSRCRTTHLLQDRIRYDPIIRALT